MCAFGGLHGRTHRQRSAEEQSRGVTADHADSFRMGIEVYRRSQVSGNNRRLDASGTDRSKVPMNQLV